MTDGPAAQESDQPDVPPCPKGGEHNLRFLRQVNHTLDDGTEAMIDIFHCSRCLGRIEQLDTVKAPPSRPAANAMGLLPRLGSAHGR